MAVTVEQKELILAFLKGCLLGVRVQHLTEEFQKPERAVELSFLKGLIKSVEDDLAKGQST